MKATTKTAGSDDVDAFLASTSGPSSDDIDAFLAAGAEAGPAESATPGVSFTPEALAAMTPEERARVAAAEASRERISTLSKVLATAQSGAQGLIPQIVGAGAAFNAPAGHGTEAYRAARDEARQTVEPAVEDAGVGYALLGALPSAVVGGPATALGRIGLAGALGTVNAAASSGADATKLSEGDNAVELLKDTGIGLGTGLLAGGIGELAGAGLRKAGSLLSDDAAKAITKQTAKDVGAVEGEVASLRGKLGSETQQGSRLLENIQRAVGGVDEGATGAVGSTLKSEALSALRSPESQRLAEKVLSNNLADLPGKTGSIQALEAQLAAKSAGAAKEAAKRTADYFAAPLFASEVAPRLRTLAPRFGMAALGMLAGEAYDLGTGEHHGKGLAAGFAGGVLGAPGVRQMLKNVAASPRVRVAMAQKLAPLMSAAAGALSAGMVPTINTLAPYMLHEDALGDHDLAAEKLVAKGGMGALLGNHPPDTAHLAGANAPGSELDKAIQQTAGVVTLADALHEHDIELDRHIEKVLKGERAPHSTATVVHAKQDFGAQRMRQDAEAAHDKRVRETAQLAADPNALINRVATNLGGMSDVAPNVTGAMTRVGQRMTEYLAKMGAAPPSPGPLAPKHTPSASERHDYAVALEVIQDPMSTLRHAQAGTLTPQRMDALKAVYPTLARQVADVALARMTESPKAVPYRARLMLGLMTGVDPDGTLATTARNQAVIHGASSKPSNAGAPSSPPKGADKLTLAQRTAPTEQARKADANAPGQRH